jgi:hypothetical protein
LKPASVATPGGSGLVLENPLKRFQNMVGTDPDGGYGKKTHKAAVVWAQANAADVAAQVDLTGPQAMQAKLIAKGYTTGEIASIQSAYAAWKARNVTSSPTVTPAGDAAPPDWEVKEAGFTALLENYWWVIAAVAAVSGGILLWQQARKKAMRSLTGW